MNVTPCQQLRTTPEPTMHTLFSSLSSPTRDDGLLTLFDSVQPSTTFDSTRVSKAPQRKSAIAPIGQISSTFVELNSKSILETASTLTFHQPNFLSSLIAPRFSLLILRTANEPFRIYEPVRHRLSTFHCLPQKSPKGHY